MDKKNRIFVAGDKNIAGVSFIQYFKSKGFQNILSESSSNLDLLNQNAVKSFFNKEKPEYVFLAYFKSGGISANMKYPAEFIYNNLQIQTNIIHYSYKFKVKKLLFLGSSCVYPRNCHKPIKEEYLFSGELEKTSASYAISKIAGIKMCQAYKKQYGVNFISVIPATIYGPHDNFSLEDGHVIASLIRRFHEAKINKNSKVSVWGTGKPFRGFIYIRDLVEGCIFLMGNYNSPEVINLGCKEAISIKKLAQLVKDTVRYKGEIVFDKSKPDGTAKKLLDSGKIAKLNWHPKFSLIKGLRETYNWYRKNIIYGMKFQKHSNH